MLTETRRKTILGTAAIALTILLGACAGSNEDRNDGAQRDRDDAVDEDPLAGPAGPAAADPARKPLVLGMYNNTAIAPAAETASGVNFRKVADEVLRRR